MKTAVRAPSRHHGLVLAVGLGMMLNPLNTSIISLAIARLQERFGLTFADVSWLVSTYYLVSAIAQPLMGNVADRCGYKRVFLGGLALVAVSSLLAPTSATFPLLLVYRALQALGTSALFPSGMGIVRREVTDRQARQMSRLSVIMSVSAAFGPSVGGFLIRAGDWPAIFTVNFPILIVAFALAWKVIPEDRREMAARAATDGPGTARGGLLQRLSGSLRNRSGNGSKPDGTGFDIPGMALFSLTIFLLLLFFLSLQTGGDWWMLGAAAAAGVWVCRHESRVTRPFVDVRFLRRHPPVCLVYGQFILVNVVSYSILFGVPSFLQQAWHLDPRRAGLVMLANAGASMLASPLAGRWIDRNGPNPVIVTAAVVTLSGASLLMTIGEDSGVARMACVLALIGAGGGFHNLGLQMSLYQWVPQTETGVASGLFMTSRFLGTIFSSTLLAHFFGMNVSAEGLAGLGALCAAIAAALVASAVLFARFGKKSALPRAKTDSPGIDG